MRSGSENMKKNILSFSVKTLTLFSVAPLGGLCLVSCNIEPAYKFKEGQPDYSNKATSNNFRIGAWVAPPPANWNGGNNETYITQESYDEVAESGVNVIYCLYEKNNIEEMTNALTYAENAGIEYLATDYNVALDPLEDELEQGDIKELTSSYNDKKALRGWLVRDEPSVEEFERLGRCKEFIEKEFPGKEFYINLLPTYANSVKMGTFYYEDYIDEYIRVVKPDFLSFDHYAMLQNAFGEKKLTEDVLWNLDIVANKCKEAEIPMYTFVQAMRFDEFTRDPNEQEIRHQVLTQLAYGSRSIQYFCYWTPPSFYMGTPAMISLDGQKGDIYNYVKQVNSEIKNIDEAFLEFSWDDTIPVTGSEVMDVVPQYELLDNPATSFEAIKEYKATQNTLISRFVDKEGREAFFVVNFSDPALEATDNVNITFRSGKKALYYHKLDKKVVDLTKHTIELEIEPGDGYFIIPF